MLACTTTSGLLKDQADIGTRFGRSLFSFFYGSKRALIGHLKVVYDFCDEPFVASLLDADRRSRPLCHSGLPIV